LPRQIVTKHSRPADACDGAAVERSSLPSIHRRRRVNAAGMAPLVHSAKHRVLSGFLQNPLVGNVDARIPACLRRDRSQSN
jgi:hypothetical protein